MNDRYRWLKMLAKENPESGPADRDRAWALSGGNGFLAWGVLRAMASSKSLGLELSGDQLLSSGKLFVAQSVQPVQLNTSMADCGAFKVGHMLGQDRFFVVKTSGTLPGFQTVVSDQGRVLENVDVRRFVPVSDVQSGLTMER